MQAIDLYFYFMVWIIFYYVFYLLILQFIHPVQAVPIINMTNPYYERHLEHIRQS